MLRTYDDWRAAGPHEDDRGAEQETETCEKCGSPVAAIDVAWCTSCLRYSMRIDRPEHEDEKEVATR